MSNVFRDYVKQLHPEYSDLCEAMNNGVNVMSLFSDYLSQWRPHEIEAFCNYGYLGVSRETRDLFIEVKVLTGSTIDFGEVCQGALKKSE